MSFKGVWMDAAIVRDRRLRPSERLVLAFMVGFPDFYASDAHIAASLCVSKKTVANALTKLRKLQLVSDRCPNDFPKWGTQTSPNGEHIYKR